MRIAFMTNSTIKPRFEKRLNVLTKNFDVIVIGVLRHNQDSYDSRYEKMSYLIQLDYPDSTHLFSRFFASKEYEQFALEKLNSYSPDIIYATDFDSLLIARKYKRKKNKTKIVFEIGDIREVYIEKQQNVAKRLVVYILKKVESRCFKYVDKLVLTSEKFYDVYYCQYFEKKDVMVFPNVPDLKPFQSYKKKNTGAFTVGFIGALRYLDQMKMLIDVAAKCGVDVLFAGTGSIKSEYEELKEYAKTFSNVQFSGKYNYEKDIANLYGLVDCIYSVYDASNPNVKIALPNKLYESILCGLPIIVSKETYLGEIVTDLGVGVAVEYDSPDELENVLVSLKVKGKGYESMVESCYANAEFTRIDKYQDIFIEHIKSVFI